MALATPNQTTPTATATMVAVVAEALAAMAIAAIITAAMAIAATATVVEVAKVANVIKMPILALVVVSCATLCKRRPNHKMTNMTVNTLRMTMKNTTINIMKSNMCPNLVMRTFLLHIDYLLARTVAP